MMNLINIIKNLKNLKNQNEVLSTKNNLVDRANKIISKNNPIDNSKNNPIEFETYKQIRYDEFVKAVRFYSDMIDDYASKNYLENKDKLVLDLIKYQNIFVKHLMKAENSTQINSYFDICMSFIHTLIEEQHIEVKWYIN